MEWRTVPSQRRDFLHVFDIPMLDDFKFATLGKIRNYLVGVDRSLIHMAGAAVKEFTVLGRKEQQALPVWGGACCS